METIEAGWNVLMDISDAELLEKIFAFNPTEERQVRYGKHVAKRMAGKIDKFRE